jgi:hypothetical protein
VETPEVLQDTPHRVVVRIGDTVRRPLHEWTPTIHELLRYLEAVDFPYSPRILGVDKQGREVLTYLHGDGVPIAWANAADERGLTAMARLLREYHEAVAGFRPSAGAQWATASGAPAPGEIVCHGDFGPWNLVWRDGLPVGILDWDYAWPAPALHDVAYALEYVVPFRDDDECVRWLGYASAPDRLRRLEMFASAYGLADPTGLVDAVVEQQQTVLLRARRLAAEGREPQATWAANGELDRTAARLEWSRSFRDTVA